MVRQVMCGKQLKNSDILIICITYLKWVIELNSNRNIGNLRYILALLLTSVH